MDTRREHLAAEYQAFGHDPERLVLAQCWYEGCGERIQVAFIDAAIGRIYCPAHTLLRVRR